MTDLTGKRALVTGGSRGIGAAIAVALAKAGADVAISYERAADRAREVVERIEATGRRGIAIQASAADPEAIEAMVAQAAEAFGGLDILVNNVGIARVGAIADMSLEDIDALLHVNVRGTILTTQAAIPHLSEGGRVITIGSNVAERVPFPNLTMYALTKSAQLSFTRGLAHELAERKITVNVVQPGPVDTDLNPAESDTAEFTRSFTALKRYGTVEEIAAVVTFVASPAASFITGTALTADGGFNA
ncbi:SDR family oxidoreductase [Sphingomonas ginsenosidivorax]|uniref:SDR family oxidoreductase n=1 Tax=Sphingomonas ginsenosidivorax TaxID=862135 RepID=A0A5C6UGW1_9SPHN|nr:SDR family oxidoreductase [Sphingomonas ginsenosidivorax]TXC71295.1 SDR family oxidoreductase [Sphingomonas ginsenosidivorax]